MARIVPARPRCETSAEEIALLTLEAGLNDAFVILQRRPMAGTMMVVHPDLGCCAVLTVEGALSFDADLEMWRGADLDAVAKRARSFAPGITGGAVAAAYLHGTERPLSGTGSDARVTYAREIDLLSGSVTAALAGSAALSDAGVNALIQFITPGAAAYVRGEVTEAQETWRSERVATALPEQVSAVTAPVSILTEPSAVVVAATGTAPVFSQPGISVSLADPNPAVDGFGEPGAVFLPAVITSVGSEAADLPKGPAFEDVDDSHPVIMLLRQAAETIIKDRQIFVAGVNISPRELTGTDFLLPALLVAAAEDWAPIVSSKRGVGGFLVRLKSDGEALLGYRVAAVQPSAPLLMLLPVVDRIRRHVRTNKGREEISMDETIGRFRQWLEAHRFDSEAVAEIDLRVALSLA